MEIRAERPEDFAAVRAVHRAAFLRPGEARLVDLLGEHGKAVISLVAVVEGRVVGHVLFSPVAIAPRPAVMKGAGLAPLGVLPEAQGRGVGSGLTRAGLAACRERGIDYVVVLGDPGYYARFGFNRASRFGLGNEYGVDEEFMVIELVPGSLDGVKGIVRYEPEFQVVS